MAQSVWDELAKDMKVAIDKVFHPLNVKCWGDSEFHSLDYTPPFYLEAKCNKKFFGVGLYFVDGDTPSYPLRCKSEFGDDFVVTSKDDWETHTDKFIAWKSEVENLIKTIKSEKKVIIPLFH